MTMTEMTATPAVRAAFDRAHVARGDALRSIWGRLRFRSLSR
ncbi:hypothetical protein [Pseudodonghicola flavimaris]|uniref:Uncharacterized protein n=1 Tax=Pseudodonghicola flavimaris TaxID=3050036 RepID=A0ABT7EX93_9RHOB|nr:hypothetical protein [Pseudodonghicola flavimaris]MDK3016965.1 hypothetical protein [Pseudodonghicola flavimaris]